MEKKLRIAVAIMPSGEWCAMGGTWLDGKDGEAFEYAAEQLPEGEKRYWVEAIVEVPIDTAEVVQGEVKEPT